MGWITHHVQLCRRCVHSGFKRGGGYAHGHLQAHGYMSCGTVLHNRSTPITEENNVLWGVKKALTVWSSCIFPFMQLLLYCTPACALPWGHHGDTNVLLCTLSGCFSVSLCHFTASKRSTPTRHLVENTCNMTIKLWAMPLVYPVLLGYIPLYWGNMWWFDMHRLAMW